MIEVIVVGQQFGDAFGWQTGSPTGRMMVKICFAATV
jgi:hypothetical protein